MSERETFALRLRRAERNGVSVEARTPDGRRLRGSVSLAGKSLPSFPADSSRMATVGQRLRSLLFPESIWEAFEEARSRARRQDRLLRLCLAFDEPSLAACPWEMVADPAGEFLALDRRTPIVRCIRVDGTSLRPSQRPALLVCTVHYGQRESSERSLTAARSALQPLLDSDRLSGDLLRQARPEHVAQALTRRHYTILHLIGAWTQKSFDALVDSVSDKDVTLVVVQSSESTASDSQYGAPLSLMQRLIDVGVAAVIALPFGMQAFLRTLYAALAGGHTLERAVTEARITAASEAWEWGLTVLLSGAPDIRLWPASTAGRGARSPDSPDETGIHFGERVDIAGDFVAGDQTKQTTELGDVGVLRDSQVGGREEAPDPPSSRGDANDGPSLRFGDEVTVGGDFVAGDQAKRETRTGDIGVVRNSQVGDQGGEAEPAAPESAASDECPHCAAGRDAGYRYCHKCGRALR